MRETLAIRWFQRLQKIPGHHLLINLGLSLVAPYSGTIRPRIVRVAPGYMEVKMKKRRAVENHMRHRSRRRHGQSC